MNSPLPLEGLRVLDFGQYIAGPMTAMYLADYGADVIRVDPPGGPRHQTAANATWNRGKRSIVLDLKSADDLRIALQLVDQADVLVENFRPGVMQRLGLGPRQMLGRNPRLVYCSIPGFAAVDPRAGMRGWEGVVSSATACYALYEPQAGDRPIYTAIPYPSIYGAFLASTSIVMALLARERDGLGQHVEVPLFNAMFNAYSNRALKVWNLPKFRQVPKGHYVLCGDGRWLMYAAGDKNIGKFLESISKSELHKAGLTPEELTHRLVDVFLTRPAAEWENDILDLGIECMTCHPGSEWIHHPQAKATAIIEDFEDPVLGRFRGPGLHVRLSDSPGRVRFPRREPDADRAQILSELAASTATAVASPPVRPLKDEPDRPGPLAGVRVLDLSLFIAGPTCGRVLAEFGADVIKIDSPHRDQVNWHCDVNRGKRTLLLDLKKPEGVDIFWRLVEGADVILQNQRKGVMEKMGIGYEQVRARKPSIVYCSINAFGQTGPAASRPGVEVMAQAMTGMQSRYGGEKPAVNPFNACDFGTGVTSAFAIALALFHRRRTGVGQHIDNALLFTATMLQSPFLQEYRGKRWDEVSGQQALGTGPLNRCYEAADGWLFIRATRQELQASAAFAELAGLLQADLVPALERQFREKTVREWVSLLNQAGLSAHAVVQEVIELMGDPIVLAHGLSVTRFHQDFGPVTTTGPAAILSATPMRVGRPSPRPGSDAAGVLQEIGMAGELERLIRDRVIVVDGVRAHSG
jgi:crotonobetainyl-CoA:carnitine CoA-transferase CaiB-like acyl-CoA transferase